MPNIDSQILPLEKFRIIEDEKLYLQPNFNIVTLEKLLDAPFRSITKSLHYYFDCSLLDYIKKKRVKYVRSKIKDGTISSYEDIIATIGNIQTFSNDYAKAFGKTPEKLFESYKKLEEIQALMHTYDYDVEINNKK